ncbi:MAG: Ni/Fe-hydrogenase cytochrome b subunit [Thermoanaerobaculia bacterium]|nr:Ni/Fe-hydrogenase cytochrome b subunit [Thermoanaerobaculia bacterium]
MPEPGPYRLTFWRAFFFLTLAAGLPALVVRYTQGIGAVSNLSDEFPWGLWIGFDLLCGVGLAAGGFTVTAMVYLLNLKRFHAIVRPAVLTAFLGYALVIAALLVDLGRPWNIWHPIIMWNPRSVMFEVGWCVMLYTTVLFLELSGMLFERFGWTRAVKVQRVATLPLVILGVLLSTLHQSSLGALYLIAPHKLHPLWYSGALPWIFWTSAVAAGLAMTIVESNLSARAFKRQLELPILTDLSRILVVALGVFGVFRLTDLAYRQALGYLFEASYESAFFHLEFLAGVVLPFVLLASEKRRRNPRILYGAALLAVMGFVVNRLNVAVTGLETAAGQRYVPAFTELLISIFIVSIGFAAFGVAVKYFKVFPEEEHAAAPVPGLPPERLAPFARTT